jgi:DNA-nicking Smr family endonuclease
MRNELDLHGTKHIDVFRKVDQFIGSHVQKGTREVFIVTGYSKEMKEIVNDVLSDYGVIPKEEWGNNGKLVIRLF